MRLRRLQNPLAYSGADRLAEIEGLLRGEEKEMKKEEEEKETFALLGHSLHCSSVMHSVNCGT